MAKRARAAGLNVLIDFHYSDFWADPDHQIIPKDWASLDKADVPAALKTFTSETLQTFADAGVDVAAVQLGNEINNGMMGDYGTIDWSNTSASFDYIASLLSSGIQAGYAPKAEWGGWTNYQMTEVTAAMQYTYTIAGVEAGTYALFFYYWGTADHYVGSAATGNTEATITKWSIVVSADTALVFNDADFITAHTATLAA
jgi:arabinogalactan endo-1,4-beta-galactosidase